MKRKIISLCIILLLLLTCMTIVSAEEFDPQKTGSISVTLLEDEGKKTIEGAELSVYYVATVSLNDDGKLNYVYTEEFAEIGASVDDPEIMDKLDDYIFEKDIEATIIRTDEDGIAGCSNLPLGLYLIKQTGLIDGFAPCSPFFVTVPMDNVDAYLYSVNATPKMEEAKLTSITIKKVWNTDASTEAAESVTVQLLQNGTMVETAMLNENNNWQVTYTDLPESDAYSIKEVNIPKGFTATYKQNDYVFTVTNTSTLIQTGQLIWPIPVLVIIGLLLISVGSVLLRKKRDRNA